MSLAISMQEPLHSPETRSFEKYGNSPGKAAIRNTLVWRTRSNVLSVPDCAWAAPIGPRPRNARPSNGKAATPAKARRLSGAPGGVVTCSLPWVPGLAGWLCGAEWRQGGAERKPQRSASLAEIHDRLNNGLRRL